jgi:hypothetical protein
MSTRAAILITATELAQIVQAGEPVRRVASVSARRSIRRAGWETTHRTGGIGSVRDNDVRYLAASAQVTHSASWLTRPANTLGNAAAAGTIRERTGAYALACTTAAVSRR